MYDEGILIAVKAWVEVNALKYMCKLGPNADKVINGLMNNQIRYGNIYCPCRAVRTEDTVCPCKDFVLGGECLCGLFEETDLSLSPRQAT